MEAYENDIFYDINDLPFDKIVELLKEAQKMSYEWWVDILDVNVSFSRKRTDMSFEDVMKRIDNSTHFVFIHRRGYPDWEHYLEIGFRTMEAKDHFLFIHVDEEKLKYFINKYNLEIL
jgi:hypothetical protein